MKRTRLALLGCVAATAALFFSCDLFQTPTKAEATATTTTTTTTTPSVSSGEQPINMFTKVTWSTQQDANGTTLFFDGNGTLIAAGDPAKKANLYFDFYFSDSSDVFQQKNWVKKVDTPEQTAATATYEITLADIVAKLCKTRLDVGTTYYYGLRVIDSDATVTQLQESVKIMPPRINDITLGSDIRGWYLEASLANTEQCPETTIGDFYFATSATSTAGSAVLASRVHGDDDGTDYVFRHYLTTAPTANSRYYYRFVAKDENVTGIETVGETKDSLTPLSTSDESRWNINDGTTMFVTSTTETTPRTSTGTNITLNWSSSVPQYENTLATINTYTLQVGTDALLTTPTYTITTASTSYNLYTLKAGQDYFVKVTAYDADKSALKSWPSPVVQFRTPGINTGKKYTFDPGMQIPASVTVPVPGTLVSNGTNVTTGGSGGGAALSLATTNSISTPFATNTNNKITNTTFAFDFSVNNTLPGASSVIWELDYDNASAAGFDPLTWTDSAIYATTALRSPVIAAVYYADDPATTTGPADPVFGVYAFNRTSQTLVGRTTIATIATINATTGKATFNGPYFTISSVANTANLTTAVVINGINNLDLTATRDYVNGSIYDNGLKGVYLTAGAAFYVDNVEYTINNTGYNPSKR